MRFRRKGHFYLGSFGAPDHTAADACSRMWRAWESVVRNEESRDDELEQIADRFRFKGRETVCNFLRQHRILIPTLIEVRTKFDEYFGAEAQLRKPQLHIFTDPGDGESTPKLFASLLTTLPFEDASSRLDRLAQEWWFDQSDEIARLLNIDVEYVDGIV